MSDTEDKEAAIDQLAADLADPIIEALSRDVRELRAEVERLTEERDAEICTGQKYRELGSSIFAEINALAAKALGHPIEPGHTAVYAVDLLIAENASLKAELSGLENYSNRTTGHRVKLRSAMSAIQSLAEDLCLRDGAPAAHAIDAAVALDQVLELASEALAATGEGGGA